jgi:hypothetical protein
MIKTQRQTVDEFIANGGIITTHRTPVSRRASASRRHRKLKPISIANARHNSDIQFVKERDALRRVVSTWSDWIVDRMSADTTGKYFPFVLQNIRDEKTVDLLAARRKTMRRVCDVATLALNPTSSRSHPSRRKPETSVGAIVLPATTINGTHLHGFLRVPNEHPCALNIFTAIIRLGFRTNNLWISRDTELDQIERDAGSLPYLASDRKSEMRDWDEIEFIPFELFARLRGVS